MDTPIVKSPMSRSEQLWREHFFPTPLKLIASSENQPTKALTLSLHTRGFADEEADDLCQEFERTGLVVPNGEKTFQVIRFGQATPRALSSHEHHVLGQSDEAYLLEIRNGCFWTIASGYRGAVHACERLRQWTALPPDERAEMRILDKPALAVRGMNRDDAEDWSESYWQTTIDFARTHHLNLLGISGELLVAEWARGDQAAYQKRAACYTRIATMARRAGIRLVPMIYNVDHFLGQFLHAAGRDELTEHFERRCIRYDCDEAWELAVQICVEAFAGIQPTTVAFWASEMVHEFYGDPHLSEIAQITREAWFYREVIRRLRAQVPTVTLMAILSQAVRDHVDIFTDALADEPVEFVHYDGEWTYSAGTTVLTTQAFHQAIGAGHPCIAKPAWSRVAYFGMPYIHVRRIYDQCLETIQANFIGIYPNASRWQTIPWNTQLGAAVAWAGERSTLEETIAMLLRHDGEASVTPADVLALDDIWKRCALFNTPIIGEGNPRFGDFRCVVNTLVKMVHQAARDPHFRINTLEEAYLEHIWHSQAHWFRSAREQVEMWQNRLEDAGKVWTASVDALAIHLDLYANALAAGWIVNREYSRDTANGPWRAWRPLLGLHIERLLGAFQQLEAFLPLDGEKERGEGELFEETDFKIADGLQDGINKLRSLSADALVALDAPSAFSALKSSAGVDGDWPRNGLYTALDWPL